MSVNIDKATGKAARKAGKAARKAGTAEGAAETVGRAPDAPEGPSNESITRIQLRRFMASKPAVIGAVVIVILVLATFVGPFFTSDPNGIGITDKLASPSSAHWLGTDEFGRDILSRALVGGRVSFYVAFGASFVAVVLGGLLGLIAGLSRGLVDELISRVFDTLLAFPMLLLAIVILAALGKSSTSEIMAIGVSGVPQYGRLVRAMTLETKQREYVRSATVLGYSRLRIAGRHIIPNVYTSVLVIATGNMGKMALAEAALSFLGIGIQIPQASWGNMISEGEPYLQISPLIAVAPGVLVTLMTISFAFVGDGLRDAFDIREAGAKS
jgi:peptide/nickel transport system permease protein